MNKAALFICIFLSSCATAPRHTAEKNILRDGEYAILYNSEKMVICSRATMTACGIRLSECNDRLKYECSTSVMVLNLKDFKSDK